MQIFHQTLNMRLTFVKIKRLNLRSEDKSCKSRHANSAKMAKDHNLQGQLHQHKSIFSAIQNPPAPK
jgi:hypothetical protein